jgi:hypothetical protein
VLGLSEEFLAKGRNPFDNGDQDNIVISEAIVNIITQSESLPPQMGPPPSLNKIIG